MGYWGYFVVGRSERPLGEIVGTKGLVRRTSAPDGWQVWEYPSADGEVGSMNTLARETGAPALFGYVMDGAGVVLEAAGPESGAWTSCLAREATARCLGAGQEGPALEDYFLDPGDAADRAVAWAAEAGHTADAEILLDLFTTDDGELAENLFFRLLDRLGVVPL
ncbi:hypothetical protein [Streptomyces sp. NPDC093094]|uniref:hypothetical protein n=1 Tax=Streptomyces sp. NPDC093094 TaxID=3366026 RepID=UPI0037F2392B